MARSVGAHVHAVKHTAYDTQGRRSGAGMQLNLVVVLRVAPTTALVTSTWCESAPLGSCS